MKQSSSHRYLAFAKFAALLAAGPLVSSIHAATATWKGRASGVPDVWNIPQNWTGSPSPVSDVVFGNSFFVGMIQNAEGTIGSLTITKEGYGFQDSGIAGASLNVTSGITVDLPVGGAMASLNTPVKLDASQTFTVNNRSTVPWNDPVNLNGKTLTLDGLGTHEVNGWILLSGPAVVQMELNGSTPGIGHDQLKAGQNMTLNNATLTLSVNAGYFPQIGGAVPVVN